MKRVVLALFLFPAALAAQATQVSTPHHHGSAQIDIVFSDTGFALALRVPSMDIVGFETPVENDDSRTRVAIAMSKLSDPLNLFVTPSEAGCSTVAAHVVLTYGITQQSGEANAVTGSTTAESHSEFQADYVIQCHDMSALNMIEFAYFAQFSGTDQLNIQLKTGGAQGAVDITRAAPYLDLPPDR